VDSGKGEEKSKMETLTPHFFRKVRGKQYAYSAEVVSATKAGQNPNAQNRKKEKSFGHLDFDNLNLFRIWDLEFRICNVVGKTNALQLHPLGFCSTGMLLR